MKKLALSASMLGALALAACGGDDGGTIVVPDGGGGDGGNAGICNPQTQAGCNQGEKCTAIFPPAGTQGPIVTGCVPDGTVADGAACQRPLADSGGVDTGRGDGTRTDDCAAGLFCDSQDGADICTPLCGIGVAGTCPDGGGTARACVGISGLFDDLPMGSETGVCVPQCAPVSDGIQGGPDAKDNDTCPAAEGCFGLFGTAEFVCLRIPEEAAPLTAFQECQPRTPDNRCFLNSAPQGAVIVTAVDYGAAGVGIVTPWCKPINTHDASADPANDANGDEDVLACGATNLASGGQGQCRFIQSMFSDTSAVPDDVGICVPSQDGPAWLDATGWNLQEFLDDQTNMVPLCPGCVDLATFMGGAAAPGRKTWDDIRKTLPKAPPELKAALKSYLKDRNAPAPVLKKALDY